MTDAESGSTESGQQAGGFPGMPGMNWGQTQDCMLCPFGLVFFAIRNTNPEVMEHLTKAGLELVLAFKAVADAAAERLGHQPRADEGLQRIDIS